MDRARQKTDKRLNQLEKSIKKVYATSPTLKKIVKEYESYMKGVQSRTAALYSAFIQESDREKRAEAKKAYMDAVRGETTESRTYNDLIKRFTQVMATVNQQAVDLINADMVQTYVENYNQVATECKRAGIKVNDATGKTGKK